MTGASLLRRLLRQPSLRVIYENPEHLPLGARAVLAAVCDLIAESGAILEFEPDPLFDHRNSLGQIVARRMRALGAEEEVHQHLVTLAMADFLLVTGDRALLLPFSPRALALFDQEDAA